MADIVLSATTGTPLKNTMHIKTGYWTFQSIGWGGILLATLFFTHSLGQLDRERWVQILFSLSLGVTLSHLMRMSIRRIRLLDEPLLRQGLGFLFMTVLFACLASMVETLFFYFAGFGNPLEKYVDFAVLNLSLAMNAFIVFFL